MCDLTSFWSVLDMTQRELDYDVDKSLNQDAKSSRVRHCPLHHLLEEVVNPSLAVLVEKSKTKKVSFGTVEIREHAVIVGDNPFVKVGLPLTIDWQHHSEISLDLNIYESSRDPHRRKLLKLGAKRRFERLQQFEPDDAHLEMAVRNRQKHLLSLLSKTKSNKMMRYCGESQTLCNLMQRIDAPMRSIDCLL